MEHLQERFASAVRHRRLVLGLSQEELGALCWPVLDRTGVSRLERTAPNISLDVADSIARALKTTVRELLEGTDGAAKKSHPTKAIFAQRVRSERISRTMSQRELGEKAGVDRNYVSDIELDKRNPRLATVDAFARALDLDPLALMRAE
ncbi:helix-turn-helix domain-containing protein [Trinickia mobilis]|uniref:helix-turn-helix domain-containing protein n=1 Tax=Trinickia mobilis TaxID=2816356 RepID=UPI001A8D2FFF|nr:helix-turn-helix transcriptional regulator [Trinickia mobilis]